MATEKRLIDANGYDAILKNREETLIAYSGSLSGAIKGCRALLDEQPIVDAVEVVHGRWLMPEEYANQGYNGWLYCSECEQPMREFYGWGYCPNCGAKMDGDRNG